MIERLRPRKWDVRELDAGDARGLRRAPGRHRIAAPARTGATLRTRMAGWFGGRTGRAR